MDLVARAVRGRSFSASVPARLPSSQMEQEDRS